ncbi:MAG: hypothetical protein H0W78_18990 [Planctomycetes bacterium]|jgi:hypothetical protein|nr:hypothetical protein [Planctomycetota bacterium]
MRLILVVALVICTFYQPLPACLNDSATLTDEQQFASGYASARARRAAMNEFHPGMLLLIIPSLALLGVAYLWLRQERALTDKRQQRSLRSPET